MHLKILLLTCLGFLFLGLGAIGILLPIWPTTPFVLLSVACFSSTPRIRAWIMKITFFREYIENRKHRRDLSQKTLSISLVWLWGMLLVSMILTRTIWISLFLLPIGFAVTTHILWMAEAKESKKEKLEFIFLLDCFSALRFYLLPLTTLLVFWQA